LDIAPIEAMVSLYLSRSAVNVSSQAQLVPTNPILL